MVAIEWVWEAGAAPTSVAVGKRVAVVRAGGGGGDAGRGGRTERDRGGVAEHGVGAGRSWRPSGPCRPRSDDRRARPNACRLRPVQKALGRGEVHIDIAVGAERVGRSAAAGEDAFAVGARRARIALLAGLIARARRPLERDRRRPDAAGFRPIKVVVDRCGVEVEVAVGAERAGRRARPGAQHRTG